LPVTAAALHASTLTYWRRRLAAPDRPNRIFDAVKAVVAGTSVLTGKTCRALDSTILDDAVATQDTVTQLIAAIRRVRREVPGAATVVAAQCRAHDYDDPGKPPIAWNDEQARAELVDALVGDAHRLLGHLPGQELGPKAADALALLAVQVLADSAYGSGEARAELADAGHEAIIKPIPLRAAVSGGFTLDDFPVNEPAGWVTFPAGMTRQITGARTVTFGAACRSCPLVSCARNSWCKS